MSAASHQHALRELLLSGETRDDPYALPELDAALAAKLVGRIDAAPLHAHAYSLHLNLRFGGCDPSGLLDFAAEHGLAGIRIHVDDGEQHSLGAMDDAALDRFGERARTLAQAVHVETSATARPALETATRIAQRVGAASVRCYPRYAGRVSEIIARTVADLRQLVDLDPGERLRYSLEQHEDLKSHELVSILRAVDNPRLSLLFDFGNMINAWELPNAALTAMAPHVTDVHVKDVLVVEDRGGRGHVGCKTGTGHVNMPLLLFRLLMLGDDVAQVQSIALEEEADYFAPAFRFENEDSDPLIPFREASETPVDDSQDLAARLQRERTDAIEQVEYVNRVLARMRRLARNIAADG